MTRYTGKSGQATSSATQIQDQIQTQHGTEMKKFICVMMASFSLSGICISNSQAQQVAPPAAEHIKWVTAELPPFVWLQNNIPQGYAYELVATMSAQMGRKPDLSFYPWARAVKMTKDGKSFGVFPLARNPERETSFKWLIPLATVHYNFFGRRSPVNNEANIELASMEQLRGLRVGIVRGSSLERELHEQNFRNIFYEKDFQSLLKMLQLGGIDAIYSAYPVLISAIEEYGFRLDEFTTGPTLGSAELYLASSAKISEQEERAWLKAYENLVKDGTVQKLRKKYISWEP